MKATAALLATTAAVLAVASCAIAESAPARPPLTVVSVESSHDVTLSDGRYRIYNTPFSVATDIYERGSCEDRAAGDVARRLLVGRVVTDLVYHRQWDDPDVTPGFAPGELRFATAEEPRGDDLTDQFRRQVGPAVAAACPNLERAPLSGRQVEPGSDQVDVDVDHDGESRFCRRHWWC